MAEGDIVGEPGNPKGFIRGKRLGKGDGVSDNGDISDLVGGAAAAPDGLGAALHFYPGRPGNAFRYSDCFAVGGNAVRANGENISPIGEFQQGIRRLDRTSPFKPDCPAHASSGCRQGACLGGGDAVRIILIGDMAV